MSRFEDAEEFLERIKNAEAGDILIFDEAASKPPNQKHKAAAVDLQKILATQRKRHDKRRYQCRDCGTEYENYTGDHCPECGGADVIPI